MDYIEHGLAVLALIMYFFNGHKKLGTYSEKLFNAYLVVNMLYLFLDAALLLCAKKAFNTDILCRIHTAALVVLIYFMLLYTLAETGNLKQNGKLYIINAGVLIITLTLVFVLPVKNARGLSVTVGLLVSLYYVCFIFITGIIRNSVMTKKKIKTLMFWILLWYCAIITELKFSNTHVTGFAGFMGALAVFFELENPQTRLDRCGLFNLAAFEEYFLYLKDNGKKCNLRFLKIYDLSHDESLKISKLITDYLLSLEIGLCFKKTECSYIIIVPSNVSVKSVYEDVRKHVKTCVKEIMKERADEFYPSFTIVKDAEIINEAARLLKLVDEQKEGKLKKNDTYSVMDKNDFKLQAEYESLKSKIEKAVNDDRITIFLQPIYSTKEKRIVSAEVLMRLINENGEVLPPYKFITAAEKSGLIIQLESIVFKKACEFIKTHDMDALGLKYLEINLSVKKGESKKLVKEYEEIVREYGIEHEKINLEITESASLNEKHSLLDNMSKFIEKGIKFSLDDFGSGESNLNYIIDMPVSIIKFDKDMTDAYFKSEKAKIVMDSAINMIHKLGLKTVVEGVETKEQFDAMLKIQTDYIQGYYFSKPLDVNDFVEYVLTSETKK